MIIGNWKMHKNLEDAQKYVEEFIPLVKDATTEIVLAVPYTLLYPMKNFLSGTSIALAAQDVFYEEKGAFTGEVSPAMVKDFATHVIIGHSERRKHFGENNEIVKKKVLAAQKAGLTVVLCIGETAEQRDVGNTFDVWRQQLGLEGVSWDNVIVAYEPVWAIGTGKTAKGEQIEEAHKFIKETVSCKAVIYGGSVDAGNAAAILKLPNVDGCLPGGASLDPKEFSKIVKAL